MSLHLKIKNQIIEDPFSQKDFEDTIDETRELLQRDKDINKENISKKISKYFYTPVKGKNPYQLTVYARSIAEIILDVVNPELSKLELLHTFQRTLPLKVEEDLRDIETFKNWFENHFMPAKKVIFNHVESLQRDVNEKIAKLRQLLKPEVENPKQLIAEFISIFEELGKQTESLINTLDFKQETLEKIKFADELFNKSHAVWGIYLNIRNEVERFFENIDNRVISINERIHLASSRLKSLYETLKYKQEFKIKIEKFLLYLLKSSRNIRGDMVVPSNIKKIELPNSKYRFISVPAINFCDFKTHEVPEMLEDQEYKRKIREENYRIIGQQENIAKWIDKINAKLAQGDSIDFTEWFKIIFNEERNLEVPVQVCHRLIHQHNLNDSILTIIKEPQNFDEDLTLWKMIVNHSLS